MREALAAARNLPSQVRAKPVCIDGKKHEVALSSEMLRQSAVELMRGGKVNIPVAEIVA
jgi:hypothetical protein